MCNIPTMTISGDDLDLSLAYRRWNNSEPLKFAEKLFAINPIAIKLSEKIQDHIFFNEIYKDRGRKKIFQVIATIIIIENSDSGYINSTHPRLEDAIANIKDDYQNLYKSIIRRLDFVYNLYYGYEFHSIAEIIPIYQSIIFLEQDGYKLENFPIGIFLNWIVSQKEFAQSVPFDGKNLTIYKLQETNRQRKFWAVELPKLYSILGDKQRDNKRIFTYRQRIEAFNRQNGICPICKKKISLSDNGHHIIPYSEGGSTESDNCLLVHLKCHRKISNQSAMLSLGME